MTKSCYNCAYLRTKLTGSDFGVAFCPYCKLRGTKASLSALQYEVGPLPDELICGKWKKAGILRQVIIKLTVEPLSKRKEDKQ